MDAVASNLGADASKLVPEKKAEPKRKRSRSRSREKYSRSPKRESKSVTPQPAKSAAPQPGVVKPENGTNGGANNKPAEESAPLPPPPTIPASTMTPERMPLNKPFL